MDSFPLPSLVAALAATILLATFLYNLFRNKEVKPKIPQPGLAWPIIGHFHLLAGNDRMPHKVLGDLADKYGPLFQMRLGAHQVLVVSDSQTAKQCLNANDKALAGRPKAIASEHIGYNYANFGLGSNTPFWRDVRKVVVLELLSNRRVEALRRFRESGAKTFIQDIYRTWARDKINESNVVKLDMKEWFGKLIIDSMLHLLFGHRYEEVGGWVKAVFRRNFELLGMSLMADYLPWLRWLDIGGYEKAIKENTKEMDRVMEDWLQQHKKNTNMKPEGEEDFMGALLSQIGNNEDILNGFDCDTVVKATCSALLAASTDTTSTTLTWALSLILNSDNVLEKIRSELDSNVRTERHVNESDLNNLTYLQAVVKETLRLYPPGPLLMPHESVDDCVIDGYPVTKGTRILINASKIHRDPKFWSNPDAFKPERFLTEYKEIDMRGNNFELIPFGSGRRICPGISLALQSVQLGLAAIIHGFDIKKASDEPIDMTEANGLAVGKATPLQVFLSPRLPSHLYL
ncbi:PREDICTED: cytochrome P450 CYP82D47-like [Ipomoea nil]|uniref:cytochrome P450 CYP82D47-like n=1 Tax=Ipomoea nil TaxID=35883 RepID=UPI0009018252|nr:PREDICTED: cytochrome P450 CYP82D47-like [Ipomoea nil]